MKKLLLIGVVGIGTAVAFYLIRQAYRKRVAVEARKALGPLNEYEELVEKMKKVEETEAAEKLKEQFREKTATFFRLFV